MGEKLRIPRFIPLINLNILSIFNPKKSGGGQILQIFNKFLSKMLRMSKFINRIYLACFGPVQNGQNTKIVKQNFCQKCSECQNLFVEIERVKHILASYKMGKKLGISFKHNFCQKCWKCQNLSLKFFGGYPCFGTIQNGQNTKIFSNKSFLYSHAEIFFKNAQNVEIYQGNKSGVTKFFTHTKWPIFTMLKSIRGRNLVLRGFSPIQNDKNSCENFQTEYFFKHPQKVKIYQGNKSGVTKFFTHTKWTTHLWKFSNWKFFQKCSEHRDL